MALLAYFKKSKPSKDILPSPTAGLFYREWIMAVGILLRTGQSFSNVGRPYSHINMIASYTRLNLKASECHRQLLQE